jgi:hypothetical protein
MDEQQFLNQTAHLVGEPVFLYNLTTRYAQYHYRYNLHVIYDDKHHVTL